jgi:Protein of unknown function with HXXEE motif
MTWEPFELGYWLDWEAIVKLQDLSIYLLAIALIVHTIAEGWLPEYEKVKPDWQSVVFNRLLFLENLPVFIFAIATAIAGWRLPILSGILPAVGLTHPLLDHLGLSWKTQKLRPGSLTGLFLLLPLSIAVYSLGYTHHLWKLHELLIGGAVGLAISVWLLWMTVQESQK